MTVADRCSGSVLRYLAVLAAAAMMMSLLPLASTAFAQEQEPIDPTDACPDDPPASDYDDRDEIPSVHVRNVDCVTHRNIALGFADNTYRPRLSVRRDQMAGFIARTIEEAGFDLPPASAHPGFADTAGNTHEDRIRQLAAAGIVLGGPEELPPTHYGPAKRVRRDQMASFLIRAAEHALDEQFGSTAQQFTDVPPTNVHFENVNAAAEIGLALGGPGQLPATQFGPALNTSRDQMASFLARLLAFLEQEPVEPPPAETVTAVSLTPAEAENNVGETHTVTATATGADDAGIEDADVRFEVTRDGAAVDLGDAATATTDANGQATLAYSSDTPGEDTIIVCTTPEGDAPATCDADDANQVTATATKTWVAVTNQAFAATVGAEQATLEEGAQREFTFDVGDAEAVDIGLALCENVTTTDGLVTFADTDNDGLADLGNVEHTDIIAVNDVVRPATGHVDEAQPQDGEVSLTIQNDGTRECVVVVVWEDADDDDRLDVDEDDAPTERFGVSGETLFATVRGVDAEPENDVNRFATQHTVTAQLIDRADEEAADVQPVPLAGEAVRFQVIRNPDTCDPATGATTGGTVIATGAETTDANGQATFSYTGPNDPDPDNTGDATEDCIRVFHDEDDDAVLDTGEATDVVRKLWQDVSAVQTLDVEPEQDSNLVGTNHTVTAQLTDEFGEPVAGETVRFEVYRDVDNDGDADTNPHNVNRTTGTNGTASFSYTGPGADATDVVVGCLLDADGETDCAITFAADVTPLDAIENEGDTPVDSDAVRKYWVQNAEAGQTTTAAEPVIGFDKAANQVDVQDQTADDNLRYLYDAGDQFTVVCATGGPVGPTDIDGFEAALSLDDTLNVTQYNPGGVSVFTLNDVDDSHPACG